MIYLVRASPILPAVITTNTLDSHSIIGYALLQLRCSGPAKTTSFSFLPFGPFVGCPASISLRLLGFPLDVSELLLLLPLTANFSHTHLIMDDTFYLHKDILTYYSFHITFLSYTRHTSTSPVTFFSFVHDPRLLWPDTLSPAADGYLYVTANQLHRHIVGM